MGPNRELKKISVQFRGIASATLKSSDADAKRNLRRLLRFVEEAPLLAAAVSPSVPLEEAQRLFDEAKQQRGSMDFPDDPREEVRLLHAVLSALAAAPEQSFWRLTYGYGRATSSRKIDDHVHAAMHELVGPYVHHLNGVIEMALLDSNDPAYGPARHLTIQFTGNSNQVSVAQDQATVHAAQQVGASGRDIVELAQALARAAEAAAAAGEDAEGCSVVKEAAEAAAQELQREQPSRFTLKSVVKTLEWCSRGVGAITTLGPQAAALAEAISGWLQVHS